MKYRISYIKSNIFLETDGFIHQQSIIILYTPLLSSSNSLSEHSGRFGMAALGLGPGRGKRVPLIYISLFPFCWSGSLHQVCTICSNTAVGRGCPIGQVGLQAESDEIR